MGTVNLHDLIFGFMRLGQFLTTLINAQQEFNSMDQSYIRRTQVKTEFLTSREKDVAKSNNFTLKDHYYAVPLVLEENNIVRSAIKHRINIVPIEEKNIVRSIYLINNKPFLGTPGIITDITIFTSWNLLIGDIDIDDPDSVNRYKYFVNLHIDAILALIANDEKVIHEEQVYQMDEILTNIFTKNILCNSPKFKFTKFEEQTNKVWEAYKSIDKNCNFPTGLELSSITYLMNELLMAVS